VTLCVVHTVGGVNHVIMSWGMRKTPARKRRDAMKRDELQTKIEEDKLLEFTMACEDGDPDGCFSLAEWHAIVDKNHEKAASMYMENCLTRAHGASCHHMGLLHGGLVNWRRHGPCMSLTVVVVGVMMV